MSEPFHGVLPALITPFTEDGSAIDAQALAANVERLVGAGVGGLVPGGSTGEFTTLTNAERRQLTEVRSRRPPAASPWSPAPGRSRRARPSS
jgi:dihydrodipicolinate synthase/N-acetylneuraminate lyase